MANICMVCDKRPQSTFSLSNAHNRVKRWVYPNVHMMKFRYKGKTSVKRGSVCTKCLKVGKIEKIL